MGREGDLNWEKLKEKSFSQKKASKELSISFILFILISNVLYS